MGRNNSLLQILNFEPFRKLNFLYAAHGEKYREGTSRWPGSRRIPASSTILKSVVEFSVLCTHEAGRRLGMQMTQ